MRRPLVYYWILTMYTNNIKPISTIKGKISSRFKLPKQFADLYRHRKSEFGFNVLGDIVYFWSYSKVMENGVNKQSPDTLERIVNGSFRILHEFTPNKFDSDRRMVDAMRMHDKIFLFKFPPPGRGIWKMGSKLTGEMKLYTILIKWIFASTETSKHQKKSDPFVLLMVSNFLGVGVGFDIKGAIFSNL